MAVPEAFLYADKDGVTLKSCKTTGPRFVWHSWHIRPESAAVPAQSVTSTFSSSVMLSRHASNVSVLEKSIFSSVERAVQPLWGVRHRSALQTVLASPLHRHITGPLSRRFLQHGGAIPSHFSYGGQGEHLQLHSKWGRRGSSERGPGVRPPGGLTAKREIQGRAPRRDAPA
jgi:hypothetical protein